MLAVSEYVKNWAVSQVQSNPIIFVLGALDDCSTLSLGRLADTYISQYPPNRWRVLTDQQSHRPTYEGTGSLCTFQGMRALTIGGMA